MVVEMNDYCNGILFASGSATKSGESYVVLVRNIDPWYAEVVSAESGRKAYRINTNIDRDGVPQWHIKVRQSEIPTLPYRGSVPDFLRPYLELHAVLDLGAAKDRKGNKFYKPRLRIYGKSDIINYLNDVLPAEIKKIQHIKNKVADGYIGETSALYYQSRKEIVDILEWVDGSPRNEKIWANWAEILPEIRNETGG